MDPEVFKSYLIKLGVQVDTAALDKMKRVLNDLEGVMTKHSSSTAMQATKGAGIIVGAYASIMLSIGKLIKQVSDADMQYQLLGQRMYMSADAVKAFKQATDTLGHSVQEIAWNAELRHKYFILVKDIQNLSVPQEAKDMMKQVRGIGFEFDRLQLASKLTLEQVAYNLLRINKGELMDMRTTFSNWVDNVYKKIPEMGEKIAKFLQPFIEVGKSAIKFFKDLWAEMKPTRDLIKEIISKIKEFTGEIPPAIKQVLILAGVLGLIFALNSPIMIAMGIFISSLVLINDYMKFKDGKESLNALVPVWIALSYVVNKAATAMGFFAIAYSHFIAFMKGEKHESGKTFFEDITDYANVQEKNWRQKMWDIGEKRKESVARNQAIEAGQMVGPIGAQQSVGGAGEIPSGAGGQVGGGRATRGVRNNNPGNLEYGSFAKKYGAVGSDGRFAVFPTMEMGIKAQQALIFGGKNYRGLTIREMIHRYAPRADRNNEEAYVARIASLTGINPDGKTMQEFSVAERNAISNAMFVHESRYSMGGTSAMKLAGVTPMGGGGGGGSMPPSGQSPVKEVGDVFQNAVGKYPQISRYFDEVTRNSDKAVETASKAVDLSRETLKTANRVYADSKGVKYRGVSGLEELLPTEKSKEVSRAMKSGGKSTGRPLLYPFYLDSPRLPSAGEWANFGKYTAQASVGSLLAAAAGGSDKLMKSILGKKLYKQYDTYTRKAQSAYSKGEEKVVNTVTFYVNAAGANAEELSDKLFRKAKTFLGKKGNVQKMVVSK